MNAHGTIPPTKSNRTIFTTLLGITAILIGGLASHATTNTRCTRLRKRKPGWRVGHRGRDMLFYEERHNGTWQRIDIDGEMLMGSAHHVIYFRNKEDWKKYPEWASERRDEIIARIKSHFREPDYEYYNDGSSTTPPPVPQTP
jgi:hypothetical protein